MITPRPLSRFLVGVAVLVWPLAGRAAEQVADPAVELPSFTVTEGQFLKEPEKWRYAEIPGFEILSDASDQATSRLIVEFERFQSAMAVVEEGEKKSNPAWPSLGKVSGRLSLIVCGRAGRFDSFAPAKAPGPETARASLFLKNQELNSIVIDLGSNVVTVLSAGNDAVGEDSSQVSVDHDKQLIREYIRYLLSRSQPRLPTWFEEGLAQVSMAMKVDQKLIRFGELEDPNLKSARSALIAQASGGDDAEPLPGAPVEDRDFNAALKNQGLLPLGMFFSVTRDAPEASSPLGNNRWAKQCYAFVHLCLYGEHGKYRKPFATFLQRAAREPVTEPMFKDCFGLTYRQMQSLLVSYVNFTVYERQEFRLKGEGLPKPSKVEFRDATQAEVGRIKGDAFLAAGYPDKARTEFTAPYIRGERDPRLLAELGLMERGAGRDDRAQKFLETAVAASVPRPRAYLELARLRSDALPSAAGGEKLTASQIRGVIEPLAKSRAFSPPLPEVYELLAATWSRRVEPVNRDEVAVLLEGVRLFPNRLGFVYQTAVLAKGAGLLEPAASLAAYGMSVSPNPAAKARFEELKASLPKSEPEAKP